MYIYIAQWFLSIHALQATQPKWIDSCDALSQLQTEEGSHCILESNLCDGIYWMNESKAKVARATSTSELSRSVTCTDADMWMLDRVLGESQVGRKNFRRMDAVNYDDDTWEVASSDGDNDSTTSAGDYDGDTDGDSTGRRSSLVEFEYSHDVVSEVVPILTRIVDELLPIAKELPYAPVELSSGVRAIAKDIASQVNKIKTRFTSLNPSEVYRYLKLSPSWLAWVEQIEHLALLVSGARYSDVTFLSNARFIFDFDTSIGSVFSPRPRYLDNLRVDHTLIDELMIEEYPLPQLLETHSQVMDVFELEKYRFSHGQDMWNIGRLQVLVKDLFSFYEKPISGSLRGKQKPFRSTFRKFLSSYVCPNLVAYTRYIIAAYDYMPSSCVRLVLSMVQLCKNFSSLAQRIEVAKTLPALDQGRYPSWKNIVTGMAVEKQCQISLPHEKESMIRFSRSLLEDRERFGFSFDLVISFANSLVQGITGPRAQWLSQMIPEYFSIGEFWSFSDDRNEFLKPIAGPLTEHQKLQYFAMGRLIGICVRSKTRVGIPLTPMLLAMLRLPIPVITAEYIEDLVRHEDPMYVNGLRSLRVQSLQEILGETPSLNNNQLVDTPQLLNQYIQEQIELKGIRSIIPAVNAIKSGMLDVIPPGFVEVYTTDEFAHLIHGESSSTAQMLVSGIQFNDFEIEIQESSGLFTESEMDRMAEFNSAGFPDSSSEDEELEFDSVNGQVTVVEDFDAPLEPIITTQPYLEIPSWLSEILSEMNNSERTLFVKFVTGLPQPPMDHRTRKWIVALPALHLSADNLPSSQTCFSQLFIPAYPSKEIFKLKLLTAISETDTLELK